MAFYLEFQWKRKFKKHPTPRPFWMSQKFVILERGIFSIDLKVRVDFMKYSGVRRKKFRGVQGYGRPCMGSGGGAPPGRRRIFENLQKYFLRKLQKCIILAYLSKKFNKPCVNFFAFGRKTQIVGTF